jgi:hypothetical protein
MSCFGLPKVLHSLFRVDVPVSNVDMASSHFQSMKELIADLGLELSDFPNVEAIATDRKKYTASLAMPGFSEDDLKTLVISIAYQCKFDRNWPTPLKHLHREVEKLVHLHAQKHPELVQVARGWAKKRPAVTAFSYKLCHLERLDLDRMMAAAGPAVMCPEFDGLVLFTHPDGGPGGGHQGCPAGQQSSPCRQELPDRIPVLAEDCCPEVPRVQLAGQVSAPLGPSPRVCRGHELLHGVCL